VETDQEIFDALENLAKYLTKHWKKEVIVLSDEYDLICCEFVMLLLALMMKKNCKMLLHYVPEPYHAF